VSDDDGVLAIPRVRGVYQTNRLDILNMLEVVPLRKGHRSGDGEHVLRRHNSGELRNEATVDPKAQ
jgi:hypothetical protein